MNDTVQRCRGGILFLGLILLGGSGPAGAGVFRCEQPGGPIFTDIPCNAEAQPIEVGKPQPIQAVGGSDLAKRYDERRAREQGERAKADSQWVQQHDAARADEERLRRALVEGRVVAGMTAQQVRQVWGEPSDVQTQIDQNASRERWVYRRTRDGSHGVRTVNFKDGRVAGAGGK
ncbi:MAG: hypothetical protein JWQ90_584 [Hydrocarboniphaga sp.]|nr:hypothetical protein [Hydrocarboniphaga sp.]